MNDLVSSTRSAISQKNWYAALTLALTLPDICGYIEDPTKSSGARYSDWFTSYVASRYSSGGHQFLSGGDCYALRCAFLHQGEVDISAQRARQALDSFHFIAPPGRGCVFHMNQSDGKLQLQVDLFAEDICRGVDSWLSAKASDPVSSQRLSTLGKIYDVGSSFQF